MEGHPLKPEDRQFDPKDSLGAQPWYVIWWYLICINTSYFVTGKWYKEWREERAKRKQS